MPDEKIPMTDETREVLTTKIGALFEAAREEHCRLWAEKHKLTAKLQEIEEALKRQDAVCDGYREVLNRVIDLSKTRARWYLSKDSTVSSNEQV